MTNIPVYEDEAARLQSLLQARLLDTAVENRFERVTRLVQNMLNVPIAAFNLIDEERQWTKSAQGLEKIELPRKDSFCTHTIQSERVMVVADARGDSRFSGNPLVQGDPNIVFYAGCPVRAPDGQRIGALCAVDKKPRNLLPREIQMLRDLAGVLETELRLDDMKHKMEGLESKLSRAESNARVDNLTRLPNRAGIMDIFKREWATAIRNKQPIAVVAADIDRFKNINDIHGLETGDEVLRQLSRILMSSLRYEDAIGRFEGGEFFFILPGCPEDRVYEIIERIRMETMVSEIATTSGILPVTVSFGLAATVPTQDMAMTDMMEHADIALMAAKKQGRNKTVLYKPDMSAAA